MWILLKQSQCKGVFNKMFLEQIVMKCICLSLLYLMVT